MAEQCVAVFLGSVGKVNYKGFHLLAGSLTEELSAAEYWRMSWRRPFSGPGGVDVTAISLWDNKASSDSYNTNTYPEVLKTMARFIE